MHYLVLSFFPISFLQNLAVAVELELLGGSSSPFPSFLFIATHHLGVILRCRDGVGAWKTAREVRERPSALPQLR